MFSGPALDRDALPIERGKLEAPSKVGYKVTVAGREDRLITGCEVRNGKPFRKTVSYRGSASARQSHRQIAEGLCGRSRFNSEAGQVGPMDEDGQQGCLPSRRKLSGKRGTVEQVSIHLDAATAGNASSLNLHHLLEHRGYCSNNDAV